MEQIDILRGKRIRLSPMRTSDAAALAHWWDNGTFMRHFDAVPAVLRTEAQLVSQIESVQSRNDSFLFGIRTLDDDVLIGQVELDGILWPHRTSYVSLAIFDPERRGQGFGHEAMELLLRFAFYELNLHRVALTVFAYNTQAIRLYERLGFVHEGTHREFLERDGQRHDMLLYGILRHEWQQQHETPPK